MRLMITGLLSAALAAGACNRADTAAAATPGSNALTSGNPSASVATAGHEDTDRTAEARGSKSGAVHEVTIPAGTVLPVVLDTPVASDTSRSEQPVRAHVSRAVVVHGRTVVAEGSEVSGVVTSAERSGKVKGRAHLALRFDTLVPRGDDERYRISTGPVGRTAPGTKKKDALEIGAPAAGGALIGGLLGGKKGALIGGAAGGGAGTAVVMSTRGKEVRLGKGAPMSLRLTQPLTIRVRG